MFLVLNADKDKYTSKEMYSIKLTKEEGWYYTEIIDIEEVLFDNLSDAQEYYNVLLSNNYTNNLDTNRNDSDCLMCNSYGSYVITLNRKILYTKIGE